MSIKNIEPDKPGTDANAGEGDDQIRQFKSDVKACFPEVDGVINNEGGTDPSSDDGAGNKDTNPPNAATFTQLFARMKTLEATVGGAAGLPIGMIAMWAGLITEIPSGWSLCNGSGGTPDLRNRFIVGAGQSTRFDIGNTGGDTWSGQNNDAVLSTGAGGSGSVDATIVIPPHVLVEDNMPEHHHYMAYDNADGFNGGVSANSGKGIKSRYPNSSGDGYNLIATDGSYNTEQPDVGRTSNYGSAGTPDPLTHESEDITIEGIEHSHEYAPSFYALAYIQFTG